jgi:hypothetical protein
MIRKILVLTSAAGALCLAAPAAAQDAAVPTPAPAAQPVNFTPGAAVVASDGAALGVVDRVHVSATDARMLHVRTPDGTVKAVPAMGASLRDDGTVTIALTEAAFGAAAATPGPADRAARPPTTPAPTPGDPEAKPDAAHPPVDPPTQPQL